MPQNEEGSKMKQIYASVPCVNYQRERERERERERGRQTKKNHHNRVPKDRKEMVLYMKNA